MRWRKRVAPLIVMVELAAVAMVEVICLTIDVLIVNYSVLSSLSMLL